MGGGGGEGDGHLEIPPPKFLYPTQYLSREAFWYLCSNFSTLSLLHVPSLPTHAPLQQNNLNFNQIC